MSVFPKRLAPGQTVTVHVRHMLMPEHAAGLRTFHLQIVDPHGAVVFRAQRDLFSFLPVLLDPRSPEAPARFEHSPLMMAWRRPGDVPESSPTEQALFTGLEARRAGRAAPEQVGRLNQLLETMVAERYQPGQLSRLVHDLAVMNASSHFYTQWTVPAGALGGRYTIRITAPGDMALSGSSPVVLEDELHVDRLRLGVVTPDGDGVRAEVINESLEAIPVRCAERDADGATTRRVDLAPGTTTMAFPQQPALILYAEGTRSLVISSSRAPLVVRNPRLVFQSDSEGMVRVTLPPRELLGLAEGAPIDIASVCRALDLDPEQPTPLARDLVARGEILLDGGAARVIELADGLHQACEIERVCGSAALTLLLQTTIVRTIELDSVA